MSAASCWLWGGGKLSETTMVVALRVAVGCDREVGVGRGVDSTTCIGVGVGVTWGVGEGGGVGAVQPNKNVSNPAAGK